MEIFEYKCVFNIIHGLSLPICLYWFCDLFIHLILQSRDYHYPFIYILLQYYFAKIEPEYINWCVLILNVFHHLFQLFLNIDHFYLLLNVMIKINNKFTPFIFPNIIFIYKSIFIFFNTLTHKHVVIIIFFINILGSLFEQNYQDIGK